MKQQHPIDDLFREKLQEHAVEPPMHLWENIDTNRDRKKALLAKDQKKYWALLGILLVAGLSIWTYIPFQHNGELIAIAGISTSQITNQQSQITHTENEVDDVICQQNNEQEEEVSSLELKISNKKAKKTSTTPQTPHHKSVRNAERNAERKQQESLKEVIKNNLQKSDYQQVENKKTNNSTPLQTAIIADVITKTTAKTLIEDKTDLKPENFVNQLPKNALKVLSFDASGSLNLIPIKETDCPTFNGLPKGLYFDVNASIDVAQRTLRSRSLEMDDYLNKRKETELPYFAFSAGIHLTALSNRGFALKSGVDYTQINEYFVYKNGHEVRTVIREVYDINEVLIGYDTTVEMGNREITAFNRYKIIDIPVLLGYELDFPNFSLNVYGGPIINVMFAKKGSFLSPDELKPTGSIEEEPEIFKAAFQNKLGIGWYTSLGFAYKLRKGTQLRFEPYFRVYPKSFTKESFPIEQKYFLTGIKIGVRQRL